MNGMTEQSFKQYFKRRYPKTSSLTSGAVLMFVDAILVMLSIGASFFIINLLNQSWINFRSFVTYWIYLPAALAVFYAAGLYPGISIPPAEEIKRFSICSFFIFAGIALSISVEEADEKVPVMVAFFLAVPIASFFIPLGREIARHFFARFRWYGVPAVIYVSGKSGDFIIRRLIKRQDFGYKPAIIIDNMATEQSFFENIPVFPPTAEIAEVIKTTGIKVAFLCGYAGDKAPINRYYRYTINIAPVEDTSTLTSSVRDFGGILGVCSTHQLTKRRGLVFKRLIDLLLLLISAPVTIPVTIVISIIVKATSKGPVFYGHKRIGKDGHEFKCWKFRSMVIDADKQLEKILAENPEMRAEWEKDRKFTNDPRVTKVGKILRKTSLDEIPQFFNILTGEMSFIGPRPVTTPELEKYADMADFILSVKPGLSGMWQISGRSDTGYEERITLDSYYIQNWSVWLDIWIIIKTIYVVIKGKGAY